MSFTWNVKLEVPCTCSVSGMIKILHDKDCHIKKNRGNSDSRGLLNFCQVQLYLYMRDATKHIEVSRQTEEAIAIRLQYN